jgi:hypothetical protein
MKKHISIALIIIGLILISFNLVRSFFYPTAFSTGIKFKVGDFVPPSLITLSSETIYTNSSQYLFSWPESLDYESLSEPVYYRFYINGKEYRAEENNINLDLSQYTESDYLFKIRACDSLNNCNKWSNEQKLVVDKTPPIFYISVGDFVVKEAIFNNLIMKGDSTKASEYIQVSSDDSETNWNQNYFQYTFSNVSKLKYLAFDYITDSKETLQGFDEVKLLVMVNDKVVFYEGNTVREWRKALINLSTYQEEELVIKFFSGNSGDTQLSSWAKVKNLTTNFVLEDDLSLVTAQSEDGSELLTTSLESVKGKIKISVFDLANNLSWGEVKVLKKTTDLLSQLELELQLNNLGIIF